MEIPLPVASDIEIRSVIRFFTALGDTGAAIHRKIEEVYGEGRMSSSMVRRWRQMFLSGRTNVDDEERSGRPSEAITADTINTVRALIEEDRRITTRQIEKFFIEVACDPISHGTICKIIQDELEMSKVCARWVPKLLTSEHTEKRMGAALAFLSRYWEEGESLVDRIVTGDEKWVHYYTPQMKEKSKQWKRKDEQTPVKCKRERSAGKVNLTVFWDAEGIVLAEYGTKESRINKDTYFDTLMRLRTAIKNKRPGKLSKKIFLIHDNARPHTANIVQTLLADFKWEVFAHPPHSPDLAPSDFHLFPGLHCHLGGEKFKTDAEVQNAANTYFMNLDANFYRQGLQKLITRYDKCLNCSGNYVEK